jgi:hypothetical protein
MDEFRFEILPTDELIKDEFIFEIDAFPDKIFENEP